MNRDSTIYLPKVRITDGWRMKRYEQHLEFDLRCSAEDLLRIQWDDPLPLRNAVHRFARYFRREFKYDFVQYSPSDIQGPDEANAFLFCDPRWEDSYDAYGACCFRWREWKDHPPGWALQWAWMHPYWREKGHFKRVYPLFRERFGLFHFEPPLSKAMRGFIDKHAADHYPPKKSPAIEGSEVAGEIL
jgi:hypothetical protein